MRHLIGEMAASTYLRAKDEAARPDANVHQAIKTAMNAGGIGRDEFPSGTEIAFAAGPKRALRCINSAGLRP